MKFDSLFFEEIPKHGGSITEGLVGSPRYINPVLAFSDTDRDLTSLIYSGLLKAKPDGSFVPDLAESYNISDDGKIYTFTIRKDAKFQDGTLVTADDVIFTIQKTQDPNIKSPKRANWDGVTVEKESDQIVKFTLKKAYDPFIENTTLGILPKHIWNGASVDEFSFSQLNIHPIGSGPYKFLDVGQNSSGIPESITLQSYDHYALGEPYIKTFIFKFYQNKTAEADAYKNGSIVAINSIPGDTASELEKAGARIERYPLPQIFGIFFNQNNNSIFTHKEVRETLETLTNRKEIIDQVLQGFGTEATSPIPKGLAEFQSIDTENQAMPVIESITAKLEKAGWKKNKDGIYELKTKSKTETFSFSISTGDAPELKKTAEIIKSQWEKIGIKVDIKIFEMNDLNQTVIRPRKYDALLFGEVIGRELDLYAFWHSSQRNDPGLNIAMYTNSKVDRALESARGTSDENQRIAQYKIFESEILNDTPAVFIYLPDLIYILPQDVKGFSIGKVITPSDRFADVENWYMDTDHVWKIFVPKHN